MAKYIAILQNNKVAEVAAIDDNDEINDSGYGYVKPPATAVDITGMDPMPVKGCTWDGAKFTFPDPAPVPIQLQAAQLLGGGLSVTSQARPEVNGTYPISPTMQIELLGQMASIQDGNVFTDGEPTFDWPDVDNNLHNFDVDTFRSFSRAVAHFVTACTRCMNGHSDTLPESNVTIS